MDRKTADRNGNQIRKLSLEHWFINYQLRAIQKGHFHLPGSVDVDVTSALNALGVDRPAAHLTSICIKAVALTLEACPEVNCLFANGVFGQRMIHPASVAVNVPLMLEHEGRKVLSALIIKEPHRKTVKQIRDEMKEARARGLTDKPITKFVATRSNNFINRFLLKVLHAIAYGFPSLYVKRGGGGVSVSSLLYEGKDAVPMTTTSFGPTAFTVMLASCWTENGRTTLRFGVGFDHLAGAGELAIVFAKKLSSILSGQDRELHERLIEGAHPTFSQFDRSPRVPEISP